jgi:fatty acid synthase, animal type
MVLRLSQPESASALMTLLFDEIVVNEEFGFSSTGFYNLPRRHGKLKDLRKFDAGFFGVPAEQANKMDPQLRLLLEVATEAILDAGKSADA